VCVPSRMEDKERLAEAGGERGLRGSDALLGTRHLGGVSGDEMVHDLVVVKFGDGREDTSGVAGKEDDV